MMYTAFLTDRAIKELEKIDSQIARMIIAWISKNLQVGTNPKTLGKSLFYKKNIYKYKIGEYRILANLEENEYSIYIIDIRHQKDINE